MTASLYYNAFVPAFSNLGVPIAGGRLYFYYTETTDFAPVYADSGLTTPLTNPVVANLAGKYPDIYLDDTILYKVQQTDSVGGTIGDAVDPYIPGTVMIGGGSVLASTDGATLIGATKAPTVQKAIDVLLGTRDATNAATAAALTNGTIVTLSGLQYKVDSSATGVGSATNDLSVDGLVPFGTVYPEHFGAVGDDIADDKSSLIAAITYVRSVSVPLHLMDNKVYRHTGTLGTYTGGEFSLAGRGTIKATTTGFKTLVFTSLTKVRIKEAKFIGGATAGAAGSSLAGLVDLISCDDAIIDDVVMSGTEYTGVGAYGCTNIHVTNSLLYDCLQIIKFRGVEGGSIVGNRSTGKISTLATFQSCIALDSTNGHAYGVCKDIIIRDNEINDWGNAEAFLMHAGQRIQFLNNKSFGCTIGLSVAAFDTGAADDIIEDVLVDGNYFDVETTLASGDISGQAGVLVSGTDDIQAKRVKVCNNTVVNSNQQWQNAAGTAAYRWTYTDDCEAYNNTAINSHRAAFLNTGGNTNLVWHDNIIQGVTGAGYAYWALNVPASTSVAKISGGRVDNAVSVVLNTVGSLIWCGDDIAYTNISGTPFVAAQVGREITITGGTNVDLSGDVTSVFFAAGAAHNIATVTNAVVGRTYLFRFNNGNTTIVRNGTNFRTVGAANLTPGQYHQVEFIARSTVQLVQVAIVANAA